MHSFFSKSLKYSLSIAALTLLVLSASAISTSQETAQTASIKTNPKAIHVTIKRGDTLSHIFRKAGIRLADMHALSKSALKQLTLLHPGAKLILLSKKNRLQAIEYTGPKGSRHLLTRHGGHFTHTITAQKYERTVAYQSVAIIGSLSRSAHKAGIKQTARQDLMHIFAGMINLNRDLRRGDRLDLLYNTYYKDGAVHHTGHVLAAMLETKHKNYLAFRYQIPHHKPAYYLPNGHSVDNLFLDFPLKFKRISSRFNLHRLDPVTHRVAPHLGIDLAAHVGTPIKSIGSGRVVFAGWAHGFGKTIKINHGHHRVSLYAHLSRFQPHLHIGQRVGRGERIGYVGVTGWTTGPHLHFGFYVKHRAVNWLKYHQPKAQGIPHRAMHRFKRYTRVLLAQLTLHNKARRTRNIA